MTSKKKWNSTITRTIEVARFGSPEDFKAQWYTHRICLDIWLVTEMTPADILGRSRSRRVAKARSIIVWLLRDHFDFTFLAIARALGRDHSTVIHSYKRMSRALSQPESWEKIVLDDICDQPWRDIWL